MEIFNIVETWLFTGRRLPSHSHPAGTAFSSDWSKNNFKWLYEKKIFLKFSQNFLSNTGLKNFLTDNHYKTIYGPVRSECSSCRVIQYWRSLSSGYRSRRETRKWLTNNQMEDSVFLDIFLIWKFVVVFERCKFNLLEHDPLHTHYLLISNVQCYLCAHAFFNNIRSTRSPMGLHFLWTRP